MNRIEKVSIGGRAFHLDTTGYEILKNYLDELESHYKNKGQEGQEILDGIEERLAELLYEKCGEGGIVTEFMVTEAIETLGKPSDIEEESGVEEKPVEEKPRKRLYRDTVDKVFGGVCSGIAAYLNIDVVLVRVIWVLLFFLGIHVDRKTGISAVDGGLAVVYLIAWICIPAAKTVKQRLEMKGEKGSVDEIQRSIESGAKQVADAAKKVGQSDFWPAFGRVIEVIIGVILIIIGAAGLFSGTITLLGDGLMASIEKLFSLAGMDYADFTREYVQGLPVLAALNSNIWSKILMGLVYFLPFIAMIYGGLMMTFKVKEPSWHPGLVTFIIWVLSVIALGIVASYYFFYTII